MGTNGSRKVLCVERRRILLRRRVRTTTRIALRIAVNPASVPAIMATEERWGFVGSGTSGSRDEDDVVEMFAVESDE